MSLRTLCAGALLAFAVAPQAWAADDTLAPTGTLRAAFIAQNVAQGRVDPATGQASGVVVDIARELGRRGQVPVVVKALGSPAAVLDAVRSGAADIGFVAPNPERSGGVLYSSPYMFVQQSALVLADSPLRSVRELDAPGQVIGANQDDSVSVWLKRELKSGQLRLSSDFQLQEAVAWLRSGEVVAFAGGRHRLLNGTRGVAGLRMLDDNLYGVPQAIAVALDRPAQLQRINAALADLRANGFLADAIARSGIAGVSVAEPPAPGPGSMGRRPR